VIKLTIFCCHGNRGWSDVNFNDIGKLLDLDNPLFGATFMALCYTGRVMANFVLTFPNFRYHGNRECLVYISTTPLNCLTLVQICSSIACISRVLANFVLENHQLVTMVTRVGLMEISTTPLNRPTPKTPTLVHKSCLYL